MWPVLASNQLKHTWVDCWTIMVDVGVPQPFHNHSLIAELDHLVLLNMREKNPALYLNQIWNTASLLEALVCCPPLAIALEDYPSIKKGLWGREKRKKRVMWCIWGPEDKIENKLRHGKRMTHWGKKGIK